MIYVGQNSFRLNIDTTCDLTGVSSSQIFIRYTSPSLSTGEFIPTIVSSTFGTLYYDFTSTQSLEAGQWNMWIYATHTDSRVSISDPFSMTVTAEGK